MGHVLTDIGALSEELFRTKEPFAVQVGEYQVCEETSPMHHYNTMVWTAYREIVQDVDEMHPPERATLIDIVHCNMDVRGGHHVAVHAHDSLSCGVHCRLFSCEIPARFGA